MASTPHGVTQLLIAWNQGDQDALDQLLPVVYDELRRLARSYLRRERPDHTLQATALVHEAYLRLIEQHSVTWQNRAHFFGIAAQMMRRILINHAVCARTLPVKVTVPLATVKLMRLAPLSLPRI